MEILLTGATGLVGTKLCKKLLQEGHNLTIIGRGSESQFKVKFSLPCKYLSWDQLQSYSLESGMLNRPDVVVHLAGEAIADGKWTKTKKERIYNSRVDVTEKFCQFLITNDLAPKTFISASAIGIYGEGKEGQSFVESSPSGTGFLSDVCKDWEKASKSIEKKSRLVHLRIGLVFDNMGGFLKELEGLFSKGLGGVIGDGGQMMSWIHINDLINSVLHIISNDKIRGAVNAVSPEPVSNKAWTKIFSSALKMPAVFFVPKIALKLALGEKAILALQSQVVEPKILNESNFKFKFSTAEKAISDLYSWKKKSRDQLFFAEHWIKKEINQTFDFFSEANNLEKITPPLLGFKIVDMSTESIKKGTLINYKLKIHGVPAKWQTLIADWQPPYMFVDNQESGPYSKWHHTHEFLELCGGTLITDRVVYRLPLGYLGELAASRFVLKDIKSIFSYRRSVIDKYLLSN